MTRGELESRLRAWGAFHMKHMEHADEYGENVLYGASLLEGRVDVPFKRDKILCPDASRKIQAISIQVNRLPPAQKQAITAWYCAPVKPDGQLYTKAEIAQRLAIKTDLLNTYLRKGREKLLYGLTAV